MALICPNCKTQNRSIAKFCIECITSLPTGFADDDFAPAASAAPKSSFLDLAFALKANWAKPAGAPVRAEPAATATVPVSKGLWISIVGLTVALIVGAAGWMVAGAGGWYLYTAGAAQVDPPRADPVREVATQAAVRVAAPSIPVAPSTDSPGKEAQPAAPIKAASATLTPPIEARGPAAVPPVAVNHRAAVAPAASAEVQRAVVQAPDKPLRPAIASTEPRAACAALNFIAEARCMAAQCLKPEFKPHAQCEAVRRQQRLEEQKRNPMAP